MVEEDAEKMKRFDRARERRTRRVDDSIREESKQDAGIQRHMAMMEIIAEEPP